MKRTDVDFPARPFCKCGTALRKLRKLSLIWSRRFRSKALWWARFASWQKLAETSHEQHNAQYTQFIIHCYIMKRKCKRNSIQASRSTTSVYIVAQRANWYIVAFHIVRYLFIRWWWPSDADGGHTSIILVTGGDVWSADASTCRRRSTEFF